MSLFDDDLPRLPSAMQRHEIGQDLGPLSVAELGERIEALRAEIRRLEDAAAAKAAQLSAADGLFRK